MADLRSKIVEIKWLDSICEEGWQFEEELKLQAGECISAGILLSETKDKISIIQSISNIGKCSEALTIPRKCIKSIEYFVVGK